MSRLHVGGPPKQASPPEPKTLMSPMAFASNGNTPNRPKEATIKDRVTPLTQDQLAQALQHLIASDKDFVAKIHKAYVDSLTSKLL